MPSYTVIGKQLETKKDTVENAGEFEFRVRTSCPPDTQLHVAGGQYWSYSEGGQWVDAQSIDLADDTLVEITFTGTNTYQAYIIALGFDADGNQEFFFYTDDTEYDTAAEAEDATEDITFDALVWSEGVPLCRVIVREDGDGGILPIEPLNRGNSYVW